MDSVQAILQLTTMTLDLPTAIQLCKVFFFAPLFIIKKMGPNGYVPGLRMGH